MPEGYTSLVSALKALTQGEAPDPVITLPMAEDDWNTRPDADSYGTVRLDFEADALNGDDRKTAIAWEGSVDLYSRNRDGAGWVSLITAALQEHCDCCWDLEYHTYERETGLFRWEWAFQTEG